MAENKYSLYSQRSATEQYVNWGKVASDITKGIVTVDADRRARKQAIDTSTSEALAKLSEVADVNNGTASALLIRGSNQSKENLMIQTVKKRFNNTSRLSIVFESTKNRLC